MTAESQPTPTDPLYGVAIADRSGPWWREWESWLLVALVAMLFLPRLTLLNVRGEEPRRAQVAVEMIDSGDWIVPRQQGELYFSRPPLQNWAIGLLGLARGQVDAWAIRLPSVLAVLGVVLLIYAYGRLFLSRTASLAAAVAFASAAQVLELGRLGETDMMFTLFVTGSLLLWHYGRTRELPAARTWAAAYFMVALGTLTKGPQAPVYFAATVGVYLLLTRRWRDAISWGHLAGIGVFLLVWGAWQVPYTSTVGLDGTLRIFGRNVAVRFNDTTWRDYVEHFFRYPLEILFGCLLPWSVLLAAYANRNFRRTIGPAKDHVLFLLVALAVTFPTLWFVPTARSRYFMPLYPCFALLIGLVVDRCWQADPAARWRRLWPQFLVGLGVVMAAAAVAVLGASLVGQGKESPLIHPAPFAVVYAMIVGVLAIVVVWAARAANQARRVAGLLAIAVFMGITLVGPFNNSLARRSVDHAALVAALKEKMPDDARLVSLGTVHHLFAYHYRRPIAWRPVPKPGDPLPPDYEYFCFHNRLITADKLPGPFETIAIISCDRFKQDPPRDFITVCRRKEN
ncbi:MAG TPA: glycosyltransferase family 39 protein [Thermoguttaceae bacterium]|nr:glycosyltransferase family 39 protein [Thermoguttaceae bacterium]